MSETPEYDLLMPFLDDSESFANGFDCGKLWVAMERGQPVRGFFRQSMKSQFEMMCRRHLYTYQLQDSSPDYFWVDAVPQPGALS